MREIRWSLAKSEWLKENRGVSFEEILQAKLVAVFKHPQKPHQNIMLFDHKGYIWVVPYLEDAHGIFLKTLFPNRKYTEIYKRGGI